MALDTTISDLEAQGYAVQPIVLPACAIGAHTKQKPSCNSGPRRTQCVFGTESAEEGSAGQTCNEPESCGGYVANTHCIRPGKNNNQPDLNKKWDNKTQKSTGGQSRAGLDQVVAMFPTPTARDGKGCDPPGRKGSPSLPAEIGGTLNPTWVEWLMGFPIGWTDLDALEMQ